MSDIESRLADSIVSAFVTKQEDKDRLRLARIEWSAANEALTLAELRMHKARIGLVSAEDAATRSIAERVVEGALL